MIIIITTIVIIITIIIVNLVNVKKSTDIGEHSLAMKNGRLVFIIAY